MYKKIEKPWGYEEILEHNEFYVVKRLFMKKGHKCSLQYHQYKKETFTLLSGKLKFTHGDNEHSLTDIVFDVGNYFTVNPNYIHRMEALEDSLYLECSTNQLDDVIRLKDSYGR
jgi:mannose-6-phosphate isomerase